MTTILRIGYNYFAIKKSSDAVKALQALVDAVPLKPHYREGRDYFTVETKEGRSGEISLLKIAADQILDHDPDEEAVDITPARNRGLRLNERNQ